LAQAAAAAAAAGGGEAGTENSTSLICCRSMASANATGHGSTHSARSAAQPNAQESRGCVRNRHRHAARKREVEDGLRTIRGEAKVENAKFAAAVNEQLNVFKQAMDDMRSKMLAQQKLLMEAVALNGPLSKGIEHVGLVTAPTSELVCDELAMLPPSITGRQVESNICADLAGSPVAPMGRKVQWGPEAAKQQQQPACAAAAPASVLAAFPTAAAKPSASAAVALAPQAKRLPVSSARNSTEIHRIADEAKQQQQQQAAARPPEHVTVEWHGGDARLFHQQQQQSTLAVLRALQNLSYANPQNFDALTQELKVVMESELPHTGSQRDILLAEAARATQYVTHHVTQVREYEAAQHGSLSHQMAAQQRPQGG